MLGLHAPTLYHSPLSRQIISCTAVFVASSLVLDIGEYSLEAGFKQQDLTLRIRDCRPETDTDATL